MFDYIKMAELLTPCKKGNAEIDIMDYTNKELSFFENLSGLSHEKYARLKINGETVMSETPMEYRTNYYFISHAYGDILIGGLGIGMIVMAIQDLDKVKSITIIEKNKNVIDIIQSQLHFNNKVIILNEDVFTYKPLKKFDCIYMDIWNYINSDIYKEMVKLKRKYGHYLKSLKESPNRFNKCWAEREAKNNNRLY